jgi:hypothetical protein
MKDDFITNTVDGAMGFQRMHNCERSEQDAYDDLHKYDDDDDYTVDDDDEDIIYGYLIDDDPDF